MACGLLVGGGMSLCLGAEVMGVMYVCTMLYDGRVSNCGSHNIVCVKEQGGFAVTIIVIFYDCLKHDWRNKSVLLGTFA